MLIALRTAGMMGILRQDAREPSRMVIEKADAASEAMHAALDNVGARLSVLRNDMGQVAHSGFQMSREAEDTDASLGQHLGAAM